MLLRNCNFLQINRKGPWEIFTQESIHMEDTFYQFFTLQNIWPESIRTQSFPAIFSFWRLKSRIIMKFWAIDETNFCRETLFSMYICSNDQIKDFFEKSLFDYLPPMKDHLLISIFWGKVCDTKIKIYDKIQKVITFQFFGNRLSLKLVFKVFCRVIIQINPTEINEASKVVPMPTSMQNFTSSRIQLWKLEHLS